MLVSLYNVISCDVANVKNFSEKLLVMPLRRSSIDMVTEVACFPSMCVKRKNKIIEKRITVKSNLETQAFKMMRLAREKFPQRKARGHCESSSARG